MSSVVFVLFLVLLQHSCAIAPVSDDLSYNSLNDILDPFADTFAARSLDGPDLNPEAPIDFLQPDNIPNSFDSTSIEIGFETDLFDDLSNTSSDPNGLLISEDFDLVSADDHCVAANGQSRKRAGAVCGDPGIPSKVESKNDDSEVPASSDNPFAQPKIDLDICGWVLPVFDRFWHVCCNGKLGPSVLDPDGRLLYSWITDCYLGESSPCFVWLRRVADNGSLTGNALSCPLQINACCRYLLVSYILDSLLTLHRDD